MHLAIAMGISLALPSTAWAQLSADVAPTQVAPIAGTAPVRWPAVAYDEVDDVYLAVSGEGNIQGQYFSASGAALGASFVINAVDLFAQATRVEYGAAAGGFLVTWHETLSSSATRVRGRIVRYNQPALTDDFDISPVGSNWEMGAAIAYSTQSGEFLVTWQDPSTAIQAQRVSSTGALLGPEIAIDPDPGYQRDPSVAYDPTTNVFLVAYAGCDSNNNCFVAAQRVQAGTGLLLGGPISLDAAANATYGPEVAFNPVTGQFLVVWFRTTGSAAFLGRTVASDGTPGATSSTITTQYAVGYDANGLAYNGISNTFLFVSHTNSGQDVAMELGASGEPVDPNGVLFGPTTGNGNFNPRVAVSSQRPEWLAITATGLAELTAQHFVTLTRDPTGEPPDAGPPDAGVALLDAGPAPADAGAGAVDSGPGPTGDAGPPGAAASDAGAADGGTARLHSASGGCGCSGSGPGGLPWGLALASGAWALCRRRGRGREV